MKQKAILRVALGLWFVLLIFFIMARYVK